MKIEDLIESIRRRSTHYADQDFYDIDIERIMQEYAEYYANKCLSIAADNASIYFSDEGWKVERYSIIDIKLPEHE